MSEILIIDVEDVMETNAWTRRAVMESNHVHSSSGKCLKWRYGHRDDCPEATK